MPIERNFVADLGFIVVDPRIRRMRQHFAFEVGFHIFRQRHVFGIALARIGLRLAFAAEQDVTVFISERPFDRDGAVTEVAVLEDFGDGFLALTVLMNCPNKWMISATCSSDNSLRLGPRLVLIFCQKPLASISYTVPLRLESIQT